jgi:hypothetical protein
MIQRSPSWRTSSFLSCVISLIRAPVKAQMTGAHRFAAVCLGVSRT